MLNDNKVIEIRKAGFINKGAQLMLLAILEVLKKRYPNAIFAMPMGGSQSTFRQRSKLGLYHKAHIWKKGRQLGCIFDILPKRVRRFFNIVLDKEVDFVLDAAGFAYTSQFDDRGAIELSICSKKWKKNNTKVILLPQAFGPFETKKIQLAILDSIKNIDLIFARDEESYGFLTSVGGNEKSNIKLAPDFTNLLSGVVPSSFDKNIHNFCVIPNSNMQEKTAKDQQDRYIPFMVESIRYLLEIGEKPFLLIHEGKNDLNLANLINESLDFNVPIITETDPLKIKGIIGACKGTIGSRFHGLVSALSQAVPALATGWSHKYEMLFQDYEYKEGLLKVNITNEELHRSIDIITNVKSQVQIKEKLERNSRRLKQLSNEMWEQVFSVIDDKI